MMEEKLVSVAGYPELNFKVSANITAYLTANQILRALAL